MPHTAPCRPLGLFLAALALFPSLSAAQTLVRSQRVNLATGGLSLDPLTGRVRANVLSDRYAELDWSTGSVLERPLPPPPLAGARSPVAEDLAIVPGTGTLWVLDARGPLYEIELSTRMPTGAVFTVDHAVTLPFRLAWDDRREALVVLGRQSKDLTWFGRDGSILRTASLVSSADQAEGLAIDAARDQILAAWPGGTVSRHDLEGRSLETASLVPLAIQPEGLAVDPVTGRIWIAGTRQGHSEIMELDGLLSRTLDPSASIARHPSGCALPGGQPFQFGFTGLPTPGSYLRPVFGTDPGAQAWLVCGFEPIRIDLAFTGASGCWLAAAPWVVIPLAPEAGEARVSVVLDVPQLAAGHQLTLQGAHFAGSALAVTDALTFVVGD